VRDRRFDAAAWDEAIVEDDRALLTVTVRLDCGNLQRAVYLPDEPVVKLGDVVAGETLARALRPGPCTLTVAARDLAPRLEPVVEARAWIVYPSGELAPAD